MHEAVYDLNRKRVWVAGHKGMVGAALVRRLASENCEIIVVDRAELDLGRQKDVEDWVDAVRPDAIFLAAAKVGGILANDSFPADFIYANLVIGTNVIHAAHRFGVEKLVYLGSSCIYPKLASQPIVEDALLTGPLEPTNEWYAIAKIACLKMCQAFRKQYGADFVSAMPTNLYGPGDNFDLAASHVLPALIRKTHEAKISHAEELVVWGSGAPRREFLHVDDCADALVHLMKYYSRDQHVNVGSGADISILELSGLIANIIGFRGSIVHDHSKPDGAPRKLMSVDRLAALGWSPTVELPAGISATYEWYLRSLSESARIRV